MRKVLWALLCLMATACSMGDSQDDEVTERVAVGDRVPLLTVDVTEADGQQHTFSTAALRGETVIVFFNTSCGDCQRALPRIEQYYRQHRDEAGFQLVAISREEDAASVQRYWSANGLTMPYAAQTDRRVYSLFASAIIPRVYFCTADGVVTRICVEQVDI